MSTFLLVLKGQIAALSGVGLSANPYRQDTPEGVYWTAGWKNTQVELDRDDASPALPTHQDDREPPFLRIVLAGS